MKILILSDNHGFIEENLLRHAREADEVWHSGDWLSAESADVLQSVAIVRSVYGNVDGHVLRSMFPEELNFELEKVRVCMRHIAGYPGKYNSRAKAMIHNFKPHIFVCGHSHILKIMRDPSDRHLHINPGACGLKGFHLKRTMVSLEIDDGRIFNINVIEQEK